jgi:hypothetical protein
MTPKIHVPTVKRMLKHYKLINSARKRGYSAQAIAKLIAAKELSERSAF